MGCCRLVVCALGLACFGFFPDRLVAQYLDGGVRVEVEDGEGAGILAPQLLLQGRVAGVEVIDDPTPGGGVTIRIRGGASVINSEPLYVVDGMPLNYGGGITAGGNPLDFVDVADVEAITVVKGAAATARYGARGGNGVVLIETRRGAAARLSYTGGISASTALGAPDVLDAAGLRAAVAAYDAEFGGPDLSSELGSAATDWRDAVQRTGIGHDHSVAYAGGSDDLTYRASVGYSNQQGVVNGTAAERASIAFGYAQDFAADRLHVRANVRGSHADDAFLAPGVLQLTSAMAPTQPIRDASSPYGGYFEWPDFLGTQNPVALLELTDDEGSTRRGFGVVEAEIDFPVAQPLSATIRLGRDGSSFERDASQPPELKSQALQPAPGFTSRLDGEMSNSLFSVFANHRRAVGALDLDVIAGWSTEEFDLEAEYENAQGDPPSGGFGWSIELDGEMSSLFARADVALHDRYVVSLGVRSDANDDERFTYPSAAIAWRVSDERFMGAVPAIGSLTLRGSWGRSASLEITRVMFPSAFDVGARTSSFQFGAGSPLYVPVDPELEPEEMTAFDVGLDVASTAGRVAGSLELYSRTTEGVWAAPFAVTNVGTLVNRGVELSIDALLMDGSANGLEWRASFVASANRAEITELDSPPILSGPVGNGFTYVQVLEEGESPDAFHVLERRADNPDFADMNGDGDVDASDLYVDRDGDGIINFDDARAYGSPTPRWILGHTSRLRFRTFDASFTLRAHVGNDVYDNVASSRGHLSAVGNTGAPANLHESVNETGFTAPQYLSDYYVEDASFLRMDHVTLGWTPGRGPVRVFGTVRNAFTLTEYRGADPAVGPSGIDYDTYPRARTVLVGANVRF